MTERDKAKGLWTAILGFVFSDKSAVLAGYALAASKEDETDLEIAEIFKEQAKALGATDEELEGAVDAMKEADSLLTQMEDQAPNNI